MALHRFRARTLSQILRYPPSFPTSHASPVVSLYRLLCSAATAESAVSSPPSYAVQDFLISRCGLTRAKAVKASKRISHFPSRSQPEAMLAFLRGTLGVSAADVAALITMDPRFLLAKVERTVAPRIAELSDLGLSREDIARLIPLSPNSFRGRFLRRNFEFWLKELGSFEKLLLALRSNPNLLCTDLDKVTAPNVAFIRQCGLNVADIVAVNNMYATRIFTMKPERLQEAAKQLEELGVKQGARMFARALILVSSIRKEPVNSRIQFLQKVGFSHDDVLQMVRKAPNVLALSNNKVQGNMDFLMKDVGLDCSYIVQRPALLMYSVERRLLPRHCLLKVLREKALLKSEGDYYVTFSMAEKDFWQKFVLPYKDIVPDLADGYASKCSGKAEGRVVLQEE